MFESTDRERGLTGWCASILLHAGLLIFCAAWLIQPARFHVDPGKTSTEMDLIFTTTPVPVTAPIKPQVTTKPESSFTPPMPSVASPAKPQPQKLVALSKPAPTRETSSPARGAIQAQPDDLHNEPPEYPEESRLAREQGVVILQVEVTAEGEPARVSILKSSGYFQLDEAARHAVQRWKFHPAMMAGTPVPSAAEVPVHFKLQ
jgi:periplasmic protein TonB